MKITNFFCCLYDRFRERFKKTVPLADPFILLHENRYYAYGTSADDGIAVWVSEDLKTWKKAGLALKKGDVWGDHWFWAPEVYKVNDRYLMYYSAEMRMCAAWSNSPLGPFVQENKTPILPEEKGIDHTLFIDDDGTPWIFFNRFVNKQSIWCARLEKDLTTIKKETMKLCAHPAEQEWEHCCAYVNEGSSVLKHEGKYFLTYSGNSYTSQLYGIGCSVADTPGGEWIKEERNPIFQCPGALVGVGHHAFFRDRDGNLRVVFHAHKSKTEIHPRCMHITTAGFREGKLYISPDYFTPEISN